MRPPVAFVVPLHAPAPSFPFPHWAVLLASVLALWLIIGGGTLVAERALDRLGL